MLIFATIRRFRRAGQSSLFVQRLAGFQSVQALDQNIAGVVPTNPDRILLAVRENIFRQGRHALRVYRLPLLHRDIDLVDRNLVLSHHHRRGSPSQPVHHLLYVVGKRARSGYAVGRVGSGMPNQFGGRPQARAVVEKLMNLRLVSPGDDRALAIRDHLLPLVRKRGTLEAQRGSVRVISLQMHPWVLNHWTPFNELSPGEASSPGYRHALERQRTTPDSALRTRRVARGEGAQRPVGGRWRFRGAPFRPRSLGR